MKMTLKAFTTSVAFLAIAGIANAQDHSMPGHDMAAMELPEACRTGESPSMPGMENMHSMMDGMGEHQKAFMQGMMQTNDAMMEGMMAEDPDIAFLCGMIPHHQAAINMARVELEHGDSDEAKQMAQMIIDAQEKEIAEMTRMIEEMSQ